MYHIHTKSLIFEKVHMYIWFLIEEIYNHKKNSKNESEG